MISVDRALDLYDPGWREAGKKKKEEVKDPEPKFNYVTPTEQVVRQAQARMREEENDNGSSQKGIKGTSKTKKLSQPRTIKRKASPSDNLSKTRKKRKA